MKKKIISLLLATLTIFSSVSVFASRADKELVNKAVQDLYSLKIVGGYEDSEFRPEENLTKGEAAKMIRYMFNQENMSVDHGIYIENEDGYLEFEENYDHWATKYIERLMRMQIIDSDEAYEPDEYITVNQFCTLLIRALGYEEDALVKNKNFGHILMVRHLKIDDSARIYEVGKGIYPDEKITRGDAAVIISNALDIPRKHVYEYSFKDGFKRKVFENNTFRNILTNKDIFIEEDMPQYATRELAKFNNITLEKQSGTTLQPPHSIFVLSENENSFIVKFTSKEAMYSDYFLSLTEIGNSDDDFTYQFYSGPFAASSLVLTDLKPATEYKLKLGAFPAKVDHVSGTVEAFLK